ncbi:hypothetical protein FKM82_002575 [Ascaphus truei]
MPLRTGVAHSLLSMKDSFLVCFSSSIQSEISFDGAYGNLKRLYDKAAKMHHQIKKCESRKLSPSKKRCKDMKRLLVSFMYLQSLLQPKSR